MDRPPRVVVVHPEEAPARRYADWVPEPYERDWTTALETRADLPGVIDVLVASDDLAPGAWSAVLEAVEDPGVRRRAELVVLYGPEGTIDPTPPVTATLRTPTSRENFRNTIRRRVLLQRYRHQFDPLAEAPDADRLQPEEFEVSERADEVLEELLEYMSVREILVELFR